VTKILVVDDEPAQARGLSRAILLRRPDFSVITAGSGVEAISVLEEQSVDLVITDLQMAEMDGFDFLAWLVNQRAHVLAFAMTAYASDETQERLRPLGSVECFSKPLDIDVLVARMTDGMAQNIRGHVHNVGLASFLQLVELEKKTCTLQVRAGELVGQLFMRKGELLDARTAALTGEEAALAILGWLNVSISIDSGCSVTERAIKKPTYHVVMEAMRVRDESIRPKARSEQPGTPVVFGSSLTAQFALLASEHPAQPPATLALTAQALAALHVPNGALAMAVFDAKTGQAITIRERPELKLSELVQGALAVVRQERSTLGLAADAAPALEEMVMMTRARGELIRPLPASDAFVLLVFDASETNLVMARLELDLFVLEYCAA
jgi:DNA-binding response OmpR family regulator